MDLSAGSLSFLVPRAVAKPPCYWLWPENWINPLRWVFENTSLHKLNGIKWQLRKVIKSQDFCLLQVAGEICYNGYKLDEFVPQKTSAYISQHDLHVPEMTVRETIEFSARCQGVGSRAGTFLISFEFFFSDLVQHLHHLYMKFKLDLVMKI